jgi:hypothetical protein
LDPGNSLGFCLKKQVVVASDIRDSQLRNPEEVHILRRLLDVTARKNRRGNLGSHISVSSIQFSYRGKWQQENYGNVTDTSAV